MAQENKNSANQQGVNIQGSLGVPPNNVVVQSMTSMSGPSKLLFALIFSTFNLLNIESKDIRLFF